jgi:hypothetical protein
MGIGLAVIAVFAVLATVVSSSAFLFQRRLGSFVDATTIASAQKLLASAGRIQSQVEIRGRVMQVAETLRPESDFAAIDYWLVDAAIDDGQTLTTRFCSRWVSPLTVPLLRNEQTVCVDSAARSFSAPIN